MGDCKGRQQSVLLRMVKVTWTRVAGSSPWEGCVLCQVTQQKGQLLGAGSGGGGARPGGYAICSPSEESSDEPTTAPALGLQSCRRQVGQPELAGRAAEMAERLTHGWAGKVPLSPVPLPPAAPHGKCCSSSETQLQRVEAGLKF